MPLLRPYLRPVSLQAVYNNVGAEGYVAVDELYFYVYSNGSWRNSPHVAVTDTVTLDVLNSTNGTRQAIRNGVATYNNDYFYIYYKGWKSIAITPINPELPSVQPYSIQTDISNFRVVSSSPITQITYGQEGYVGFDEDYFYLYSGKLWRKFTVAVKIPVLDLPATVVNWASISTNWDVADWDYDTSF